MDWLSFDREDYEKYYNCWAQQYPEIITPGECLEQDEYYQQFELEWDDTLLFITMLPE